MARLPTVRYEHPENPDEGPAIVNADDKAMREHFESRGYKLVGESRGDEADGLEVSTKLEQPSPEELQKYIDAAVAKALADQAAAKAAAKAEDKKAKTTVKDEAAK